MKPQDKNGPGQTSNELPARRPYRRPELTEFGNVRDLTRAAAGKYADGVGGGQP